MKRIFILLLIITGAVTSIKAQFYTISPNDTIIDIAPPSQLTIFDIYQHNATADTIQLAWTKVYESIPVGWDYSLCDLGTCYPGFPSSGSMALIAPPDSGFLGVNIDPYALPGTLTVRFYVYETSAPAAGDTLTWIITAQTTGTEEITSADFRIYPNPSTDHIQIDMQNETSASMCIYDLNGRVIVQKALVQDGEMVNVSNLPASTYILELKSKNIIRKTFIKE